MRRRLPREIKDNFIEMISQEWMLVTAGTPEKFNAMTANWGGVGFLWNKPVATIYVRPERYTYGLIEETGRFSLSFLGREHQDVHRITGSKSGRDTDKIAEAGLHPRFTESGGILYEETRLGLECRVLYGDDFRLEHFRDQALAKQMYLDKPGGLHRCYIGEITAVWAKE